jgi:hypothetical protein
MVLTSGMLVMGLASSRDLGTLAWLGYWKVVCEVVSLCLCLWRWEVRGDIYRSGDLEL